MSEPDLFVVCKNCSAEVSPYVTECPYCGQRVRKRAPKLDRGTPTEAPRRRIRPPRLPRLRREEIPGIAPETRPYVTIALIVLSAIGALAAVASDDALVDLGVFAPIDGEWWRLFSAPFVYDNFGYGFIALIAVGIFGTHLERRFGPVPVVLVFLAAGAAGVAASAAFEEFPVLGGNGAALALLMAWLLDDRRALRRGSDRESDMLGVYVIAAALVLLSLATTDASVVAAAAGALVGTAAGLLLPAFVRR